MPYYEVVYETGNVSVMNCENDEEMFEGTREQDRRAREGGQAGPQGGPAERVAKIYKYDKPPNDYNVDQTMSADVLKSEVTSLIDGLADSNGVVSIPVLAANVQAITHPMQQKENVFDSQFKMQETEVLTLEGTEEPPTTKGSK